MIIVRPNSELAVIRGAATRNPAMGAALAACPRVATSLARLDNLLTGAEGITEPDPTVQLADVDADVLAAIDAGKPLPPDLPARITAARRSAEDTPGARSFLQSMAQTLSYEADQALKDSADDVLTHLHGQLTECVSAGRAVEPKLKGARDADAAIAAGTVSQWQKITTCEAQYVAIRSAQRQVCRLLDRIEVDDYFDSCAYVSNILDLWPDWPMWKRHGQLTAADGTVKRLTAPWPNPKTDPAAHFWWVMEHPTADAWVPAGEQYAEAYARLRTAVAALSEAYQPAKVRTRLDADGALVASRGGI